jgi:hypothetical protein
MSDPDYMSFLEAAAGHSVSKLTPEQRVLAVWDRYEHVAKIVGYDVLGPVIRLVDEGRTVRRIGSELIVVCYEAQPEASTALDIQQLREKNAQYGGSWAMRGGQGAFFTFCRKADRLKAQIQIKKDQDERSAKGERFAYVPDTEDTIGDLRRYMILCEAWHLAHEKLDLKLERVKRVTQTLERGGLVVPAPLKIDEEKFLEDRRVPRTQFLSVPHVFVSGKCVTCGCEIDAVQSDFPCG